MIDTRKESGKFLTLDINLCSGLCFVCKIIDITFPKGSIIQLLRGKYCFGILEYK